MRERRRARRPAPAPAVPVRQRQPLVPLMGGLRSDLLVAPPLLAPASPQTATPVEAIAALAPMPEVPEVELLIPPPPPELEARAQSRARRASSSMNDAGTANRALPAPTEETAAARAHVNEPAEQTTANAQGAIATALREKPAPSPNIEQLCDDIQDAIENRRPVDEDSLRRTNPQEQAQAVGDALNSNISEDGTRVGGEYAGIDAEPTGLPEQLSEQLPDTPRSVSTPSANAAGVTPPPAAPEDVSLEADRAATATRIEEANIDNDVTREIPTPPFSDAREGMAELEQTAAEDPALVLQEQAEAIAESRGAMRDVEVRAMAALAASRGATVDAALSQQIAMAGSEEEQRVAAAAAMETIFTTAQGLVNGLLEDLVPTATAMWNKGKETISTAFDTELKVAKDMVDERHEGVSGAIVSLWDSGFGLPAKITNIYTRAERTFGRDICALIREVSTYVNGIVIACEELIDKAESDLTDLRAKLPEGLQDWATQQQEGFSGRLDTLRNKVHDTQQNFTDDLVSQAGDAVQEARERIDALREAAKGLIQKVADAIAAFIDDPVRAIINGLLTVVGIAPGAFWALVAQIEEVASDIADDPLGFAGNLLSAIGLGFSNFFDRFFGHLMTGFITWLFSAMGTVGVELPPDTSLKSIITFFLQLMGLTWPNIREILARHIGEENVELLEKAYELLALLIEEGPGGIFELIKEKLDPAAIMNTIMEAAVSYMVETIVSIATVRILGLFNPVGAILQAVEAIYKVLKWIFENAARIFTFVQTIVSGLADIIAGNIAGMAAKVEEALAGLLVPVIDFIAGFLGLGDLPEKIAEVVGGFQEVVLAAVDRAIGFLAEQARGLLQALGLGGEDEEGGAAGALDDEVGENIRFSAGNENHRLWIDTAGSGATVMVASEAESLEDRVRRWNRVEDPDDYATHRLRIDQLLPTVTTQLGITDTVAEDAEDKIDAATGDSPTAEELAAAAEADERAETEQAKLVPYLRELFVLFDEPLDLSIFDPDLSRMSTPAIVTGREELEGNREEYLAFETWSAVRDSLVTRSGSDIIPLHERPLGRQGEGHGFQTDNFESIFVRALGNVVQTVADSRGKTKKHLLKDQEENAYALARRGVIHTLQPDPPAEESARGRAQATLQALQRLLFVGGNVGPAMSAAKAYFTKSLEGYSTHSDYKPVKIEGKIEEGKFYLIYHYGEEARAIGVEDFTVQMSVADAATDVIDHYIVGNNLSIKPQGTRGTTAGQGERNRGEVTTTVDLHSAHLIADWFRGSGYRTGLNLLLTSSTFNTETMYNAEKEIKETADSIAASHPGQTITFNLHVTSKWKAVRDNPTISALRGILPAAIAQLPEDKKATIMADTLAMLTAKTDPMICQGVDYFGEVFADGSPLARTLQATTAGGDTFLELDLTTGGWMTS